jgi:hypothetical protein
MAVRDSLEKIWFGDKIKLGAAARKSKSKAKLIGSAKRLTQRGGNKPKEAFVKITSFGTFGKTGAQTYKDKNGNLKTGKNIVSTKGHARYIARDYKLDVETSRGDVLKTSKEVNDYIKDWDNGKNRNHQRDVMNLVVGAPESTKPKDVLSAAKDFMAEALPNHEWIMVLHEPGTDPKAKQEPEASKHPHVHIDVAMKDRDGVRLNPNKEDLHYWREVWAEKMQERGYDIVATPRRARNQVATKKRIEYIPDKERPGKKIRIDHEKIERAIEKKFNAARWEEAAKGYLKIADELDREPDGDKKWAKELRAYAYGIEMVGINTDKVIKLAADLGYTKKSEFADLLKEANEKDRLAKAAWLTRKQEEKAKQELENPTKKNNELDR